MVHVIELSRVPSQIYMTMMHLRSNNVIEPYKQWRSAVDRLNWREWIEEKESRIEEGRRTVEREDGVKGKMMTIETLLSLCRYQQLVKHTRSGVQGKRENNAVRLHALVRRHEAGKKKLYLQFATPIASSWDWKTKTL